MKYTLILLISAALLLSGCININTGKFYATPTTIEQSGILWPTYTVYVKSDLASSKEEQYCVEDYQLIETINAAAKDKKSLEFQFKGELFVAPWRCNSDQEIITGVK